MALIDQNVPVVRNEVLDLAMWAQALEHADIGHPPSLVAAASELTDRARRDVQKGRQPFPPLVSQLLPVDQHQGVDAALGDEPGTDHGLAEGGGRGENSKVMGSQSVGRLLLGDGQLATERQTVNNPSSQFGGGGSGRRGVDNCRSCAQLALIRPLSYAAAPSAIRMRAGYLT